MVRTDEERAAVSWLGTPYQLNAKVKGAGVDCGTLLIAAFHEAGLIPDVDAGTYKEGFNLHRGEEVYIGWMRKFCAPVEEVRGGDIILYKFGRIVSHGSIVVEGSRVIHAIQGAGVVYADLATDSLRDRIAARFSFWGGR